MLYSFAQHLLLRMPVKTPSEHGADLQSFLDDQFFRSALYLASPIFYATLERHNFREEYLSEKEATTLLKYINRYCFRPTPFGLFSSVTLVNWIAEAKSTTVQPEFRVHVSAAMTIQNLLATQLLANELRGEAHLIANPSIYRLINEYRFFRTSLDESAKHRDYQLQSIAFSKLLKDLIANCAKGCPRQEVVKQIVVSAGCTSEEAEDYTDFLIDSQLLLHSSRLTITGEDPLASLMSKLKKGAVWTATLNSSLRREGINYRTSPKRYQQLADDLGALVKNAETADKLSTILHRDDPHAGLDLKYQDQLRDGIAALKQLSSTGQQPEMAKFIKGFQQHFEGQALPLLLALDPEAGVGYQHAETEKNNPLLETLNIPYRSESELRGSWSQVHSLLMNVWLRERSTEPVIQLREADLDRLNISDPQPMLGMSVLFRVTGYKVFIENAGGINAPALMGRFTVADETIANAAQAMARQLELQNPDIIFAELLQLADPHTDNVNRRAHIYQYELPVTAASTLPEAQQIQLSDLYIKVVNNKVLLFSEKHQKVVIPRLTSAYNHSLNKLPLFRFLADLPYQYGISSLNLDLRRFFPGLHFYPRVEYKETILSLATWILGESQLNELQQCPPEQTPAIFIKLRNQLRLPRYFSLAEGDQELVFDGDNPTEVAFFCNCIRRTKELVIKEFLKQPVVRQYNAYLLPCEPLNLPLFTPHSHKIKLQRKFMPGSEWLYLKIYTPKIGADRLLLRLVPLLRKHYGAFRIGQWFFIRYEDHAPHIRLRLQVKPDAISDVLIAFKTKLEDRIKQHVIREFQIDVYNRELERYAAGGIRQTEQFFWASSELVLHYFKQRKNYTSVSTHVFALYTAKAIISAFITDADEQIAFTLTCFQQFLPEFTAKPFKVELDKKYRELIPQIMDAFSKSDPGLLSGSQAWGRKFMKSLQIIRQAIKEEITPTDYLRSIIHMHFNRIFTDESRKQEMICYYLLHKYLLSVKGRNRKSNQNN